MKNLEDCINTELSVYYCLRALIPGSHKQFISKGLAAVSKRPPVVQLPLFWQGQTSNCGCRNAIAPKLSMAINVNVVFSNSVRFQVNVNKSPSCVKYSSRSSSPRETLKLLVSVTLNIYSDVVSRVTINVEGPIILGGSLAACCERHYTKVLYHGQERGPGLQALRL